MPLIQPPRMLQVDLFDDRRGAQVRHKAQHRYDQFVPNVRERIAPCAPMTRRTLCWAHFARLYTPGSSLTEARFCLCNRLAVTVTPSFHVPPDLAVRDPYSRHQPVPLRSQGNRLRHSSRTGHHYYRHAAIVDDVVHRKADHGRGSGDRLFLSRPNLRLPVREAEHSTSFEETQLGSLQHSTPTPPSVRGSQQAMTKLPHRFLPLPYPQSPG
jgi:hypothetical protein